VVLVETVGVGQSEVEIAGMADTTLVLLAPGMGDGIQAAKAGILEVGDIYVVNKADRDGVQSVPRDLRSMLALAERAEGAWTPPILKTVASRNEGVAEVVQAIEDRLVWMPGTASSPSAGSPGPGTRSRRSRRRRCGPGSRTCTATRGSTSWRPRSRTAAPTRILRRTS